MNPATLSFSLNVLIVLFVLTVFTFVIFISGENLGITNAILLLLMYGAFIFYILLFHL